MGKKTDKRLIVGLDVGTSKVVAIVGEVAPEGEIEVIGLGSHPSRGIKKDAAELMGISQRALSYYLAKYPPD